MKTSVMQCNFTGGVWTPLLDARIDIEKSKNALAVGENGFVYPHGGFRFRGGTRYVGEIKDSASGAKMVPFIFNRTTAYNLEFGAGYIRIWNSDGTPVESLGVPIEIETPYELDDLYLLQKKQTWDVVYFTHPNYPVYRLKRKSEYLWTFNEVYWQDGPYLKENIDQTKALTPSATTGNIILTFTDYAAEQVGGSWEGTVTTTIQPYQSTNTVARVRVTIPAGFGSLKEISVKASAIPTTAVTLKAMIYATSAGNPTTLVDQAINTCTVGGTALAGAVGRKRFNFNNVSLTVGAVYIFEIKAQGTATGTAFEAMSNYAGMESDYSVNKTDAFSALGTDYRFEYVYTKAGTFSGFEEGHIGSLWRLRHAGTTLKSDPNRADYWSPNFDVYGKFTVDVTPDSSHPWIGKITLQKSFDYGTTWYDVASFFYSTTQEFVETKTGITYRIGCKSGDYTQGIAHLTLSQDENWGVVKITDIISAYQANATVVHKLGSNFTTTMWAEGAWSGVRGYPAAITCHEDRFYYAGTTYQPTTIWATWVGDYENHMPSDTAESALNVTLVRLDSPISWIDSFTAFLIGTLGEEAWVKGTQAKPITSDNIDSKVQGATGSCQGIRPIRVGSSLFHLQLQRRQIREIAYNFEQDGYISADRSNWARHLLEPGIKDLAYQKDPHQNVWALRFDGKCAVLSYYPEEKVMAWSLVATDGDIESISVVPDGLGLTVGEDKVWMVVKRTINGSTKRYIEILENNTLIDDASDYFNVDCGITYDGVSTDTITGLDHLEGETVCVLGDGAVLSDQVVSSGSITLETSVEKAQVGLPYTMKLQPMRIEVGTQQEGVSQGRIKRFIDVTLRLLETIDHDGTLCGANQDDTSLLPIVLPVADRARSDDVVDVKIPWQEGWEEAGQVYIEQSSPAPMTVAGIIYKVEMI